MSLKVEVLLPTYNRVKYLRYALESVCAQTYENICVTVVDSASNDGTKEYLESFADSRVKVIRYEDNLGIAKNIERAFAQVEQDFVITFHDDDVMENNFISSYVEEIEEGVALYHCAVNLIDQDGGFLEVLNRFNVPAKITKKSYVELVVKKRKLANIVMPTVMLNVKLMKCSGVWPVSLDKNLSMLVDMGLWVQINEIGDFKYIDKRLLRYRQHVSSGTSLLSRKFLVMFMNRCAMLRVFLSCKKNIFFQVCCVRFFVKSVMFDLKKVFF